MFTRIDRKAIAEFDLCAVGPVIVGSGRSNELDPTLPDMTFLSGNNGEEETFVIPGSTIKGVIRHYIGKKINDSDAEEFLFGKLGRKGRIAHALVNSTPSAVTPVVGRTKPMTMAAR